MNEIDKSSERTTLSVYRVVCDCGKFLNMDRQKITRQKIASCGCVTNPLGRPRR